MNWIEVAKAEEVRDDEAFPLDLPASKIALYRIDDQIHAIDNVCSHQFALLSDGYFEDGCIECPLHQARFDVRTGRAMCAPATADLKVYAVKVEAGSVFIDL